MQAKDIDDVEMLGVILEEGRDRPANWVFTWDLERRFPAVPPKVVLEGARAASAKADRRLPVWLSR